MAYQKQDWRNLPDETTPISAERLIHMEEGIYEASLTEVVNSMDGNETDKAPSVNAVKDYVDKNTYSTDEIVIGTYLGKPLYRKVITGNLSMSEIQHGLSNFVLRNCYGMFYNSNSGKYFPVPSTRPFYHEYEIGLTVSSTAVNLERASNVQESYMTIEIVLEYTKTTDV